MGRSTATRCVRESRSADVAAPQAGEAECRERGGDREQEHERDDLEVAGGVVRTA
jgi:hypothetical protein